MTEPVQIPEDYLFAKIGRLTIEVEVLRAQLAAAEAKPEAPETQSATPKQT